MSGVSIRKLRYTATQTSDSWEIFIPSLRHPVVAALLAFYAVTACFLTGYEMRYLTQQLQDLNTDHVLLAGVVFTIVVSALSTVLFLYALLWQLFGEQYIKVGSASLQFEQRLLRIRRVRDYALEQIHDLHALPPRTKKNAGFLPGVPGFSPGSIEFDFAGEKVKLAYGISHDDAGQIASTLSAFMVGKR